MMLPRPVGSEFRISSLFGEINPKLRGGRPHKGVDFACPVGTPVKAVVDGVISLQRYGTDGSAAGNRLWIYKGHHRFGYFHLDSFETPGDFACFGKQGVAVKEGDTVGYSGNTGASTGPHLHFEVRELQDDMPVCPVFYEKETEDKDEAIETV